MELEVDWLEAYFSEASRLLQAFVREQGERLRRAIQAVVRALRDGHKLLVCGNGGSAADAQHLAAELVCRMEREGAALPALALTANGPIITAWANDHRFEDVFARQVEALGRPGDVLVAISTSGRSPNVIQAVQTARRRGLFTIGLLGRGGRLAELVDLALLVPSSHTPHVQECHVVIYHALCRGVEAALRGEPGD